MKMKHIALSAITTSMFVLGAFVIVPNADAACTSDRSCDQSGSGGNSSCASDRACNPSGTNNKSSCTSERSCDPKGTEGATGAKSLSQKAKDYIKKIADAQKQRGGKTSTGSTKKAAAGDGGGKTAPAQTTTTTYPGAEVAGPKPAYPAAPAGVKEIKPKKGNVLVITYLDQDRVDSKGNRDKRLGLVNVKVEKVSGSAKCSNRKGTTAKTNGVRTIKRDGEDVLVKGTANWRNCNEGKYKVTAVGRDGYTIKGDTTKEVTVTDDNTEVVKFVLSKNKTEKKKKSSTKKTSDAQFVTTRRLV